MKARRNAWAFPKDGPDADGPGPDLRRELLGQWVDAVDRFDSPAAIRIQRALRPLGIGIIALATRDGRGIKP